MLFEKGTFRPTGYSRTECALDARRCNSPLSRRPQMTRPSATPSANAALSAPQEVTLRRVAFGQSDVRAMRTHDLAELKRRGLIEEGKDGPVLTRAGEHRFNALPKSS